MVKTHEIEDIEAMPIYVVSAADEPWTVSEDDFIDGVPLRELTARLTPEQHLYPGGLCQPPRADSAHPPGLRRTYRYRLRRLGSRLEEATEKLGVLRAG